MDHYSVTEKVTLESRLIGADLLFICCSIDGQVQEWVHVAVTHNYTGNVSLYINGHSSPLHRSIRA